LINLEAGETCTKACEEPSEYSKLPKFLENYLFSYRTASGDFDFGGVADRDTTRYYLTWIIWFLMTIFCGMICLNFLIAEATNSYNAVNENLKKYIWKHKAR